MLKRIVKLIWKLLLLFIGLVIFWLLFIEFKAATNEGDWQEQVKLLPDASIQGDIIRITNLRDYRYNEDGSIKKANYLNKEYNFSEMHDIWYGISHFGDNGLAHVLLSFEFKNEYSLESDYLVLSIEARLENKHVKGYNPVTGLFGMYNKTIVLSTEKDVIGLRTHIRKEPLNLYRLKLPELYENALLINFLRDVSSLNHTPELYNSIFDNCMTGLLAQSKYFRNKRVWLDKRILFPGNSDKVAYELGIIDTNIPFEEVRAKSLIDPSVTTLEASDFSEKIRIGK